MSTLNTVLFAVGIVIFMITVYGTVMAGGQALKRKQKEELAPDIEMAVRDDGWEVITSSDASRD